MEHEPAEWNQGSQCSPVSAINSAHPLALRPDRTSGRQSRRPPDALAARAGRRAPGRRIPHQQADSGGGNAENRRSMERMTQRMGELLVMHRVGRNHIERTAQIVIQQPQNAINHIVDMDPGQVLSAIADRPAEAELKGGCHFAENTAPRSQYHARCAAGRRGCARFALRRQFAPSGRTAYG